MVVNGKSIHLLKKLCLQAGGCVFIACLRAHALCLDTLFENPVFSGRAGGCSAPAGARTRFARTVVGLEQGGNCDPCLVVRLELGDDWSRDPGLGCPAIATVTAGVHPAQLLGVLARPDIRTTAHEQSPVGPSENGRKVHPSKVKRSKSLRVSLVSTVIGTVLSPAQPCLLSEAMGVREETTGYS